MSHLVNIFALQFLGYCTFYLVAIYSIFNSLKIVKEVVLQLAYKDTHMKIIIWKVYHFLSKPFIVHLQGSFLQEKYLFKLHMIVTHFKTNIRNSNLPLQDHLLRTALLVKEPWLTVSLLMSSPNSLPFQACLLRITLTGHRAMHPGRPQQWSCSLSPCITTEQPAITRWSLENSGGGAMLCCLEPHVAHSSYIPHLPKAWPQANTGVIYLQV